MINRIIGILEEVLDEKIDITSAQKECENWDSLHHLNLMLALENEFNIEFEPEEISKMTNVKKIIDIVGYKLNV